MTDLEQNDKFPSYDWWRKFELWKPENNPFHDLGMPTLPFSDWYETPLDKGIERVVRMLRYHGVETVQSCEGGEGHAFIEPTVRFIGEKGEGFRVLGIALSMGFPVKCVRKVWDVENGEPTEICWELILTKKLRSD